VRQKCQDHRCGGSPKRTAAGLRGLFGGPASIRLDCGRIRESQRLAKTKDPAAVKPRLRSLATRFCRLRI